MLYATLTHKRGAIPALSFRTVVLLIASGAVATVAFDIWGQVLSVWLGLGNLSPDGLARSLLGTFGLPNGAPEGLFMHLFVVGLIAYPVGWLFVFRPLTERMGMSWLAGSAIYGFVLWLVAIGGVTLIAEGVPLFLNFTRIAWVALVGHVLYGIVCGWTVQVIDRDPA